MQTIDLQTTIGHAVISTPARNDLRAAVRHLSQEKIDRCILDAARSTVGHGSSCAAMLEYSEACYPESPSGHGCNQN